MNKIEKEKQVVSFMIDLYIRKKPADATECAQLNALKIYAHARLDHCKFGEHKTSCKRCPVHCYKPEMRTLMRKVMRFSGPRMMLYSPWQAIKHLLDNF